MVSIHLIVILLATITKLGSSSSFGEGGLAKTPPMGWMSWQAFRCETNCTEFPESCINQKLYLTMAKELVRGGYLDAGYKTVSVDDCWMDKSGRESDSDYIIPDRERFPDGMRALADKLHRMNLSFGLYYDMGSMTCERYTGTKGHIISDVRALNAWEIDYIKVDGCNNRIQDYEQDYTTFGSELRKGRPIVYSCSWPAYLEKKTNNETMKPYDKIIKAGCNLWRNWLDVQCSWSSLVSIINHFGDYSRFLQQYAAPGHWNDMDMLLIGEKCINHDEAETQMAIWCIMASPLIMGNDLRQVDPISRKILLNKEAIAVSQDSLGKAGYRLSKRGRQEIWIRSLSNGDLAVALINKSSKGTVVTFIFSDYSNNVMECSAYNIFARQDIGVFKGKIALLVPSHGTRFLRLKCNSFPSFAISK